MYDTYGTVTKKTGTLTVLFLYNGRDGVVTDSNGFLYMRARYYSPQLKRFINADVVAGSIQESPTLNRYAYVNGNPISYVDPFGLSAEPGSNWVDTGHMVLDILGLLPVVGGIFDGTNVIWYLLAGDLVNAGFSATAFLPIIGDAAGAGKLLQNAASKIGSQAAELFAKYGDDVAKWADDILGFAKKERLELALPDGGSLKLWGDSAGNTVQFAVGRNLKSDTEADLGRKLDYLFGKATGDKHNIERSKSMRAQLSKIGIQNTEEGRNYLSSHLNSVLNDQTNITAVETKSYTIKELPDKPVVQYCATTRESLLMGPGGGLKVRSIWNDNKLITIILEGGR